jgi:hypothetical protein
MKSTVLQCDSWRPWTCDEVQRCAIDSLAVYGAPPDPLVRWVGGERAFHLNAEGVVAVPDTLRTAPPLHVFEAALAHFRTVLDKTPPSRGPVPLPIGAAASLAKAYGLRQVIITAWDGSTSHLVTYGESASDSDQATVGGKRIMYALGWRESLLSESAKVKVLRAALAAAEARIAELTPKGAPCD